MAAGLESRAVCAEPPHKHVRNIDTPNIIDLFAGMVSQNDDALVMLDTPMATPWTRSAYDHRLRAQVVKTGTRCLPKHIAIPRSYESGHSGY
jgi:hypothetical protein